ncbi:MAG: hypothetical protein ACLR5S_03765 [Ruminococcus sp.]
MAMKIHARGHQRLAKMRNTTKDAAPHSTHSAVPQVGDARRNVLEQADIRIATSHTPAMESRVMKKCLQQNLPQ